MLRSDREPKLLYLFSLLVSLPLLTTGYRSVTCHYNGQEYYPGLTDIEPCVTCHCDGDTGNFTCSYKECPTLNDPTCTLYATPPGQCCAQCVQHGCFHEGRGYPLGARIPGGPCAYCYCPWDMSADGRPVCVRTTCPETACPGVRTPPGKCCPVCPESS